MHNTMKAFLLALLLGITTRSMAEMENYTIDTEGKHAFIQFKIQHLGFSWLYGEFKNFSGEFSYDEADPSQSKIAVEIDVDSLDTGHAKRDKHLRGEEYLDVKNYPKATFVSTSFQELGGGKALLKGDFTLHGITKNITIEVTHMGHGKDPWGGYRRGFYGTTSIKPADYGLEGMAKLGPHSEVLYLEFSFEGIRQAYKHKVVDNESM